MATIKDIFAYEIIDSRGYPTVEARLVTDAGWQVTTSIPSGTSIGKYEAVELRDNDKHRFDGMGVTMAVKIINTLLAPKLKGIDPRRQLEVDRWMIQADGTKRKEKLGANATLAISQLLTKAAAVDAGVPLFHYINALNAELFKEKIPVERIPTPIFNIINGGKHANNNLEFQEFQIIPSSSFSFTHNLQIGADIFHELKRVLLYRNANISVGEEGGFAPNFSTNLDAIEVITETITQKNLKLGIDVFLGLDIAAAHFFQDDKYHIKDRPHPMRKEEYIEFILALTKNYSFLCIEDPLNQDDFNTWTKLNEAIGKNVYLIGDDLLCSDKDRVLKAIKEKSCTTLLLKPNQLGTISEVLEVISLARKNNMNYVISQRSGETEDSFIADLSVAIQADFVKFGATSRGERVSKYNRLWQIEREELKLA
jgi:enolase